MGKAAENEGIKLRAIWFNNLSVGLLLGGVFLPAFSLFKAENFSLFHDWREGRFHPTVLQWEQLSITLMIIGWTFVLGAAFRREAKKEIAKIQD
jgi:hypothetical protein